MKKVGSSAFTLVEILIVMVIIGFLMVVTTRFVVREPRKSMPYVLGTLNDLAYLARQESQIHSQIHRFVFRGNEVWIEKEEDTEDPARKIFKSLELPNVQTKYQFPSNINLVAVFVDGIDMLAENKGRTSIHITPDGMMQPAFVHLLVKRVDVEDRFTLKVQPFLGTFELIEGWERK